MNTASNAGFCRIYFGRINTQNKTVVADSYGQDGYDYAFPSIAPFSTSSSDRNAVIGFLRTGASIYPEFRVATCVDNFDWSNSILVKEGESYVNTSRNGLERWGDYSGICRRHNPNDIDVWVSGCYGDDYSNGFSNRLTTWIGRISDRILRPPSADFFANMMEIDEGGSVQFEDASDYDPTEWKWAFPGGQPSTSTEQNPTVSYPLPGNYDVQLISTNGEGSDTLLKTAFIKVNAVGVKPDVDFRASDTVILENETVGFFDLSENKPTSWTWTFPGGNPSSSTDQNPDSYLSY